MLSTAHNVWLLEAAYKEISAILTAINVGLFLVSDFVNFNAFSSRIKHGYYINVVL